VPHPLVQPAFFIHFSIFSQSFFRTSHIQFPSSYCLRVVLAFPSTVRVIPLTPAAASHVQYRFPHPRLQPACH
jgi:hypothetical protein